MRWLAVPGLPVEVAVPRAVEVARGRGGEVRLTDGRSELRLRRAAAGEDAASVKARLAREAGAIGFIAHETDGDQFRIEYVVKDRKTGQPSFGLAMRRVIGGVHIDCASRGPDTGSTAMAQQACRLMRAAPR